MRKRDLKPLTSNTSSRNKGVVCERGDLYVRCLSPKTSTSNGGTGGSPPPHRKHIPAKLRFKVLRRCGFRCRYCGRPSTEVRLGIDHVVAVSRRGTNAESNLVACCLDCNIGKGTLVVDVLGIDFIPWLLQQAERDDWVGDLARDEVSSPSLSDPGGFRDLASQIRAEGGDDDVVRAAWHAWREYRYRGGCPTLRMQRMQAATAPIKVAHVASSVNARVLHVADVLLREWADEAPPVWESLYTWLVSLGFKDEDLKMNARALHNRVHCGDLLMARLREAEGARLRRMRKLRGEKLKRAVVWSDLSGAPIESWRGRDLIGDALFVFFDRESAPQAQVKPLLRVV